MTLQALRGCKVLKATTMLAVPVAHGHRAVLGSFMGCQGHKMLITLLLPALAAAPTRHGMLRGLFALGPLL